MLVVQLECHWAARKAVYSVGMMVARWADRWAEMRVEVRVAWLADRSVGW